MGTCSLLTFWISLWVIFLGFSEISKKLRKYAGMTKILHQFSLPIGLTQYSRNNTCDTKAESQTDTNSPS